MKGSNIFVSRTLSSFLYELSVFEGNKYQLWSSSDNPNLSKAIEYVCMWYWYTSKNTKETNKVAYGQINQLSNITLVLMYYSTTKFENDANLPF